MGTTYMDFSTGVFHVDGDAPLTQAQVDAVWRHLPTTGASWIEHGNLFVQQFDGAEAFNLGPVERGVEGTSDKVRFGVHSKSHAQLNREIAEALNKRRGRTARSHEAKRLVRTPRRSHATTKKSSEWHRGDLAGENAALEVIAKHGRLLGEFNLRDLKANLRREIRRGEAEDFDRGYVVGYERGFSRAPRR
jgi:hypothetical protein